MTAQRLHHLRELKSTTTTIGQLEYLDELASLSVELCQRPGDWQRVANIIDALLNSHHTHNTPSTALSADLSAFQPENVPTVDADQERLTQAHTAS